MRSWVFSTHFNNGPVNHSKIIVQIAIVTTNTFIYVLEPIVHGQFNNKFLFFFFCYFKKEKKFDFLLILSQKEKERRMLLLPLHNCCPCVCVEKKKGNRKKKRKSVIPPPNSSSLSLHPVHTQTHTHTTYKVFLFSRATENTEQFSRLQAVWLATRTRRERTHRSSLIVF